MAWPGWQHFDPRTSRRTAVGPGEIATYPVPPARAQKYHAQPTEVDGHLFPSKREAERYLELQLSDRAGTIRELRFQVAFPLRVGEIVIGRYLADFTYTDVATGGIVVEDAKGMRTPLYQWKRKHFEAQYGIRIREV